MGKKKGAMTDQKRSNVLEASYLVSYRCRKRREASESDVRHTYPCIERFRCRVASESDVRQRQLSTGAEFDVRHRQSFVTASESDVGHREPCVEGFRPSPASERDVIGRGSCQRKAPRCFSCMVFRCCKRLPPAMRTEKEAHRHKYR